MRADVDVFLLLHDGRHLVRPLINSLERTSVPVTAYFLDNGSVDGTPDRLAGLLEGVSFRAHLFRSSKNNGFARGMNLLTAQGSARFMFVLNPDTILEEGCLEKLLDQALSDPKIAICEARQAPREHQKTFDPITGETTWCSGAAALIRRQAFQDVGGFDERLFFMYCEDVDVSWRLWLRGWKCVLVPDAVVNHYTQDRLPGKKRTQENYFSFRNSLFLFYRFGSWSERRILIRFLRKRFLSSDYSLRSKALFAIAFMDHIRYIPYLFRTRSRWSGRKHQQIRFDETSLAD